MFNCLTPRENAELYAIIDRGSWDIGKLQCYLCRLDVTSPSVRTELTRMVEVRSEIIDILVDLNQYI